MSFPDLVAQPNIALLRLAVAAVLGLLLGLERERSDAHGEHMFAGVRTFPLFALLGATIVLAAGAVGLAVAAGFLAVAALVIASYARTSATGAVGATTEMAALAAYWLGVLAGGGALLVAGALGITVAVLLMAKERLEAFPRALSAAEVRAALTFAVITVIVLPVLPDARYGPWDVWNPRRLWLLVVLVSGLSFAAFVAMRLWGSRRGLYVSGLLGGLVSSTAVTVSFAEQSRRMPQHAASLAAASGLASLVMLARVGVLAVVTGPAVLGVLGPFLAGAGAAGGVALALLARRHRAAPGQEGSVTNPFSLVEAIKFAALFAAVLLAVEAARRYLGSWGVVAAAAIAGLTDVDAITLSLAGLSREEMAPRVAGAAIAIAALANTAAKGAYASWLGEKRYREALLTVLGAAFLGGLVLLGAAWMAAAD